MMNLTRLLPWTIERLLYQQYVLATDSQGNPKRLELEVSLGAQRIEDVEEDLRQTLRPEHVSLLCSLKYDTSHESVRRVLTGIFGSGYPSELAASLEGAGWSEVLSRVYWFIRCAGQASGERLVAEREGAGADAFRRIESQIEEQHANAFQAFTEEKYARDLAALFPEIVARAERLRILETSVRARPYLSDCLAEATRSYVFGHFLACVVLCRSAVEAAVSDRLVGAGAQPGKGDSLEKLLKRASDKDLLEEIYLEHAHSVRKVGRDAVHGRLVPDDGQAGICST